MCTRMPVHTHTHTHTHVHTHVHTHTHTWVHGSFDIYYQHWGNASEWWGQKVCMHLGSPTIKNKQPIATFEWYPVSGSQFAVMPTVIRPVPVVDMYACAWWCSNHSTVASSVPSPSCQTRRGCSQSASLTQPSPDGLHPHPSVTPVTLPPVLTCYAAVIGRCYGDPSLRNKSEQGSKASSPRASSPALAVPLGMEGRVCVWPSWITSLTPPPAADTATWNCPWKKGIKSGSEVSGMICLSVVWVKLVAMCGVGKTVISLGRKTQTEKFLAQADFYFLSYVMLRFSHLQRQKLLILE